LSHSSNAALSLSIALLVVRCGGRPAINPDAGDGGGVSEGGEDSGDGPVAESRDAALKGPFDAPIEDSSDPVCVELAPLSVGGIVWGSTAIVPGDTTTLTITLTETGSQNCCSSQYPGIVVNSDNSDVTLNPPGENGLFAITAGSSSPLVWMVSFGRSIPPTTVVHFHAEAAIGGQHPRCSDAGAIDFQVTLQ